MKMPGGKLTKRHWEIIRYLRKSYYTTGKIPTICETCEANHVDLDELELLFPDGYYRGAIKLAGLRLRYSGDESEFGVLERQPSASTRLLQCSIAANRNYTTGHRR